MGPVLSFRGAKGNFWRVTALIVIPADEPPPAMLLDGKSVDKPVELARVREARILRYDLSTRLNAQERRVKYGFDQLSWEFTVPSKLLLPRIAYVSCNGFSEPDAVRNLRKPLFAVWNDLLCNHDKRFRPAGYKIDKEQRWHEPISHDKGLQRFHLLAMGGDQIYFDSIWTERDKLPELSNWTELSFAEQVEFDPPAALRREVRDYYETLYIDRWRARRDPDWGTEGSQDRASATGMAAIPTIMMWDDHDIFDGWGSYPPKLQYSPLFALLFAEARRAFWIYQLQQREADLPPISDKAVEGYADKDAPVLQPIDWTKRLRSDPLALPFINGQPGFSYRLDMGEISLLILDLRSERSQTQIMGEATWDALQGTLKSAAKDMQHLLIMSSVPVAYPKLGLADIGLGIAGGLGLAIGSPDVIKGLADDLNDHWTHGSHDGELKRFIRAVIGAADFSKARITILSGDVHVASWGTIVRKDVTPFHNWMRVNQLTSSSIVHPPPAGLSQELYLQYASYQATKDQEIDTDYMIRMMKFPDSDGYLQPRRNWLAVEIENSEQSEVGRRRLWATWRCENQSDDGFSNHLSAIHPVSEDNYKKRKLSNSRVRK